MKTKLTPGLNIISGDFSSNMDNIKLGTAKSIIAEINELTTEILSKMLIPCINGYNSIITHIEEDDDAIIAIVVHGTTIAGISDEYRDILVRVATRLKEAPTDKTIVFAIDAPGGKNIDNTTIFQITQAYGNECLVSQVSGVKLLLD